MVNVPVRLVVPLLADTVYPTVPLPLPLLLESMVIQMTLLTAVQAHPLGVVTVTLPLPPPVAKD